MIQVNILRDFIVAGISILLLKMQVRLKISSKLAPLISITVPPLLSPEDGKMLIIDGLGKSEMET